MNICHRFFTTVLIFLIFVFNAHAEETWKITSLNWEPYSGEKMSHQGDSIQKLRDILQSENIRLIVEFYPWARAQHLAKTKDYVGYFPAWPEEVEEGFVASQPVDWSEIGVLKQSGVEIIFDTIEELFKKYTVGLVSTYIYPELIENAAKKYPANVDMASDEVVLLQKLSQGRHPVAITDPNVMMFLAEQNGIHNVELFKILMKKELVIAFRDEADNKERLQLLNNLLK